MKYFKKFESVSIEKQLGINIEYGEISDANFILDTNSEIDFSQQNWKIPNETIDQISIHQVIQKPRITKDIYDEQLKNWIELFEKILNHTGFSRYNYIKFLQNNADKYQRNYYAKAIKKLIQLDPESNKIIDMNNKFDIL